jgi:hypothetical protein
MDPSVQTQLITKELIKNFLYWWLIDISFKGSPVPLYVQYTSLCEPKNVNSHVKVNFIFLVRWLKFWKMHVIAFIRQPSVMSPLPFSVSNQTKLNFAYPILSFPKF